MVRSSAPIRSFFVLMLLGAFLGTMALVVRSHLLSRPNPGRPMSAAMRATIAQTQNVITAADDSLIDLLYPNARTTASGLRELVRAPGQGTNPKNGTIVTIRFSEQVLAPPTGADNQALTGETIRLLIGSAQLGQGADEALRTMRKGERRTIIVPWWLGPYGAEGKPPAIPTRATLVQDITLVDFVADTPPAEAR